jgi:peptidoglycan L-alanyl-D-glutamate endopeptidase CwlK
MLGEVHPDLVRVVSAAYAVSPTFQVVYGLRTLEAQKAALASGHSTTLHSRHLADANYGGKACAIDVAAIVAGAISWDVARYPPIAQAIKAAAATLRIPVEWGGDWHWKDYGHFQLPWSNYP